MHSETLHDPALFAAEANSDLLSSFDELILYEAAPAMASYKRARTAYLQFIGGEPPYILQGEPQTPHPFHLMDEAVMALSSDAYRSGLAAGAVFEQLRRTLVDNPKLCSRCDGRGSLSARVRERQNGHHDPRCPDCNGAGIVR